MFLGKIWCFQYVKNSFKIPRNIVDHEIEILKVKDVCGNFLTIFFIFSALNYIEIPSQAFMTNENNFLLCTLRMKLHRNTLSNLHDKWDKFFTLHFTLPVGLVDIYPPAVRSRNLPEISSDFMYKFCIL